MKRLAGFTALDSAEYVLGCNEQQLAPPDLVGFGCLDDIQQFEGLSLHEDLIAG